MSSAADPRTALTRVDLTLMGEPPDCEGKMAQDKTRPYEDLSIAGKRLAIRRAHFAPASASHWSAAAIPPGRNVNAPAGASGWRQPAVQTDPGRSAPVRGG